MPAEMLYERVDMPDLLELPVKKTQLLLNRVHCFAQ